MWSTWRASVVRGLALMAMLIAPGVVRGEDATEAPSTASLSGADTAFMMVSAALVMLMTPGLGLFYGGMVRRKNVLATFQQSFILLGLISLQWMLFGYSLAFGRDTFHGLIGGLDWAWTKGVGMAPNPDYSATIPHQLFGSSGRSAQPGLTSGIAHSCVASWSASGGLLTPAHTRSERPGNREEGRGWGFGGGNWGLWSRPHHPSTRPDPPRARASSA